MGITYIITIILLLLMGTSVYPQTNDDSDETAQKPREFLKLIPEHYIFLEGDSAEDSSATESDEIDLNQLLHSYTVYPSLEFNLTNQIRSANRNKSMILWGGVVPFFAIPDPDNRGQESSFSGENFSIFWHLKKKF